MTTLLLIFLFWLPIVVCTIDTLFWYVSYQQNRGFSLARLASSWSWDFKPAIFNNFQLLIHIVSLGLILTSILIGNSFLGVLGICVVYISWTFRTFNIWQKVFLGRLTQVTWNNLAIAYYLLLFVLFSIYPIVLTSLYSFSNTLVISPVWLYTYVLLGTLGFIVYELLMPLFCLLGVIMIQPFIYFIKRNSVNTWIKYKAKHLDLFVIGIMGSYGKSTIGNTLNNTLNNESFYSDFSANDINDVDLPKNSVKYLIVNIDFYDKQELSKFISILQPNILIHTGISQDKVALWQNNEAIISEVSDALKNLNTTSLLIINIDDPLSTLCIPNDAKFNVEYYSTQNSSLAVHTLDSKIDSSVHDNLVTYVYKSGQFRQELSINKSNLDRLHSWLASAATLQTLNESNSLFDYLQSPINHVDFELFNGDNNTNIIKLNGNLTKAKLKSACLQVTNYKVLNSESVLVCDGISMKLKNKMNTYQQLSSLILVNFDVVISTDKTFLDSLKLNNTTTKLIHASTFANKLYWARKYCTAGNTFVISGYNSTQILQELKSDF